MDSDCQLALFSNAELKELTARSSSRSQLMQMDGDSLQNWKKKVFRHQQQAREVFTVQQTTLFDIVPMHCKADQIDPFSLLLQSMAFYRMPTDSFGQAAIYFVIDSAAHLVLYIGETCRSNKRWKGHHDCKRYIENYQSLHYEHGLPCAINMAFWWDTPANTRARQQLESSLIHKWRAPFNKQNWSIWSAPFA